MVRPICYFPILLNEFGCFNNFAKKGIGFYLEQKPFPDSSLRGTHSPAQHDGYLAKVLMHCCLLGTQMALGSGRAMAVARAIIEEKVARIVMTFMVDSFEE